MGFERLSIDCESIENRDEVFKVLDSIGGKGVGEHDNLLFVHLYEDGEYQTYFGHYNHDNSKELTYKQFMEKYAMSNLKKKIEEAKKVTGLSASALSEKLGFQHKYLTNAVRETSEQRKKEIIAKLDGLIFKEENELTHDFEGKSLNVNIADAVMVSKSEYEGLKKELEHKNQVLDKRNDLYQKLELECKDKDEAIKQGLENVAGKILAINELESQLKATQEKFIDTVDCKDKEIEKLQNDRDHATNQYQGKRAEVVRLSEKVKKQATIYMIIIAILFIASIIGFAS